MQLVTLQAWSFSLAITFIVGCRCSFSLLHTSEHASNGMSLGVLHFDLPGRVPKTSTGAEETVMLNVFLKGFRVGDSYEIRGLAFATGSVRDLFSGGGGDISQVQAAIDWQPNFWFKGVENNDTWRAEVASSKNRLEYGSTGEQVLIMPLRFTATLPADRHFFEFHVDEWNRYRFVDTAHFHRHKAEKGDTVLAAVIPPIFGIQADKAAILVAHHASYHVHIGFSKEYVYVRSFMRAAYLANEDIARMVKNHQIVLIEWDEVPECVKPAKCYKSQIFGHLVLGLWGTNERVLLVDMDEVLALPHKMSMDDFLRDCAGDVPLAHMWRYNMVCSDCSDSLTELDLWTTAHSNPLQHYNSNTGFEPNSAGKCIANPNDVHGYEVHYGIVVSGNQTEGIRLVDKDCGRVIHMPNQVKKRLGEKAWSHPWTDWKWALEGLEEPRSSRLR